MKKKGGFQNESERTKNKIKLQTNGPSTVPPTNFFFPQSESGLREDFFCHCRIQGCTATCSRGNRSLGSWRKSCSKFSYQLHTPSKKAIKEGKAKRLTLTIKSFASAETEGGILRSIFEILLYVAIHPTPFREKNQPTSYARDFAQK